MSVIEVPNGYRLHTDNEKEVLGALENVERALTKEAKETYLPTLILSQNSWEEHLLAQCFKAKRGNPVATFERKYPDRVYSLLAKSRGGGGGTGSNRENENLETVLVDLWGRRLGSPRTRAKLKAIKNSLIFQSMLAASPGLIKAVRSVAELGLSSPKCPPLPSVLVVAPPGAGKEMMSKLIPLLSKDFWDKPIVTLNMGSIMLDVEGEKGGFRGLLKKLGVRTFKEGGTIVLDELNSLNITAQPVLLRILEQGEISLSSPASGDVLPWLFIGLINEEPSRLTLETLRDRFIDDPIFGELLGTTLYEHFKGKSRLRDDLYYRIRRCGEIRIDGLNKRRPDIPIVFYFKLRQFLHEAKGENEDVEVFLTYDAMESLIDKSLDWKGNMRKLENVTRQIKGGLKREPRLKSSLQINGKDVEVIQINGTDVKQALLDLGMLKGPGSEKDVS